MRFFSGVFASVVFVSAWASGGDLAIKVIDPRSAPVVGAQVALLQTGDSTPVGVNITSAEGTASFRDVPAKPLYVRVLAPGFAAYLSEEIPASQQSFTVQSFTVQLHLAPVSESVVVTATRSPVPSEEAGASVADLSGGQIETMNPVAASDGLRFLPGAIVATAGQRGGLGSLFVRGGDSRYNKVIVDGVPVDEPGGRFNFGVVPLTQTDRLEFVRGAQSTLYGSDAMTSVVQVWTRAGSTQTPELRFGADGGNFDTAHGFLSLSGARGIFDYNAFADQFNSNGKGPNDDYANSLQGANLGFKLGDDSSLRFRTRHSNSHTGVQGEWNFNGQSLIPPDLDQRAAENDLLASTELSVVGPSRWQHRFTGFEYNHRSTNIDSVMESGRVSPTFGNIDFPFHDVTNINRAGFEYQGDYVERSWAQTTIGYEFEDENGFVGDVSAPSHGLRLNHAVYGQQLISLGRLSAIAGARFVHNGSFGNTGVPRVAVAFRALRGGEVFSGTQLRCSYATGIKEPVLEESFASGPFVIPNPNLKAEENRSFEAGVQQSLFNGRYTLGATYYHNLFRNQIAFSSDPNTFIGQYVNVNKSIAHGAEVEFHGRPMSRLSLDAGYNYTSTQILAAPFAFDPLLNPGRPLVRRPKHSGSLLLTYLGNRWGGNLGGSFIGRRPDSDFLGFGIDHAAGYARVDVGGWYAVNSRMTAYVNVENALNKRYEEVAGYPALGLNVRGGIRFRIGGE